MNMEQRAQWKCGSCVNSQNTAGSSEVLDEQVTLKTIMMELKAFRCEFGNLKDVTIPALSTNIADLNKNFAAMNKKFECFDKRLMAVETAVQKTEGLEDNYKKLESQVKELIFENDKMNQYGRSNNVEISGIPYIKGENLYSIIRDLCVKVGLPSLDDAIDSIHRVRRYTEPVRGKQKTAAGDASTQAGEHRDPSIILRLSRRRCRDELIAAVRSRRGLLTSDIGIEGTPRPVYVNEHLTPKNKLLLRRVRELKAEKGYMYVWVRNCVIHLRKSDNAPVVKILCEDDLKKII